MRISHSHKFIFFALPRTGSTTIREMLDDFSDIRSIHISETTDDFPFYHHISALELKEIFENRGWKWDDYKKFCFIRNPYDRIVSLYHHHVRMRDNAAKESLLRKIKNRLSSAVLFEDFVFQINAKNRLTTSLENFICDDSNNILVDDILRFEHLEKDISNYLGKLNIVTKMQHIPHLNASENRRDYRKYYTPETRRRIAELYRYEIDKFGYSF